jgi:hypothetical protein
VGEAEYDHVRVDVGDSVYVNEVLPYGVSDNDKDFEGVAVNERVSLGVPVDVQVYDLVGENEGLTVTVVDRVCISEGESVLESDIVGLRVCVEVGEVVVDDVIVVESVGVVDKGTVTEGVVVAEKTGVNDRE